MEIKIGKLHLEIRRRHSMADLDGKYKCSNEATRRTFVMCHLINEIMCFILGAFLVGGMALVILVTIIYMNYLYLIPVYVLMGLFGGWLGFSTRYEISSAIAYLRFHSRSNA